MSMLDIFAIVASSNQMCVDIELSSEALVRLREPFKEIKQYNKNWMVPRLRPKALQEHPMQSDKKKKSNRVPSRRPESEC